ncbi:MAG: hypothetical protein B7X41_05740 [Microbacterium sp. 14-71-5]|jgi:DTW domain-containing protein YfiP|nr:MAG: hypothetical protein B7X41_05740 [Microbacterium sp. 14-71-5]
MNSFEVNALLVRAGQIDARLRRNNTEERADMVEAWAVLLDDLSPADAGWALIEHYKRSRDSVMPADLRALVEEREPVRNSSWAGNVTEQRLEREALGAGS